jgi:hypothetical protein
MKGGRETCRRIPKNLFIDVSMIHRLSKLPSDMSIVALSAEWIEKMKAPHGQQMKNGQSEKERIQQGECGREG